MEFQTIFVSEEDIRAEIADAAEEGTFAEQLQAFYDNELDELHDSSGDPEYQQGVLGRMDACEALAEKLGIPFNKAPWEYRDQETPLYNK